MLGNRWNGCISLDSDYVNEEYRILSKSCCFVSEPTNLLTDGLPLKHAAHTIVISGYFMSLMKGDCNKNQTEFIDF